MTNPIKRLIPLELLLVIGLAVALGFNLETQAADGVQGRTNFTDNLADRGGAAAANALDDPDATAIDPEIAVLDGAVNIPDNTGSVNFGTTTVGQPITKTFIISNSDNGTLFLTDNLTVPNGFSVVNNFGTLTVTTNLTTSFAVRLNATGAGSFTGTLSFGNNDPDENPFNFTISGTVTSGSIAIYLPLLLKSSPQAPPSGSWTQQTSGVSAKLNGLSCPTTTICVAVGAGGVVVTTGNGGTTWSSKNSGVATNLNSVSCQDVNNCVAVGDGGRIITTSDGGASWTPRTSNTAQILRDVGCATTTCLAVGGVGTSTGLFSLDGGVGWITPPIALGTTDLYGADCPSNGTCTLVGLFGRVLVFAGQGVKAGPFSLGPNLFDVNCPTDATCFAVGQNGAIQKTGDGGSNWGGQTSGVGNTLRGVSCPTDQTCFAVGDASTIITTANSGAAWSKETVSVPGNLNAVSCPATAACFAAGDGGIIVAKK